MQFSNGLVISDSLYQLIQAKAGSSECLKVLERALRTMRGRRNPLGMSRRLCGGGRTRLLAKKMPGNYFSFRETEGMISFMPTNRRQQVNDDGTWVRKGRQAVKPGRWIRAMLHPKIAMQFGDDIFAQFSDIVKHEELRHHVDFELVTPESGYTYRLFNQAIGSCMWNKPVAPFYDAFGAKVLIAKGDSARSPWRGKALVWPNVELKGKKEPIIFMDRIYAESSEMALAFKEYAADQGWWRKLEQNRTPESKIISPDGSASSDALVVRTTVDLSQIAFYPYLDTLCYGRQDCLSNNDKGYKWKYQMTNGTREGDHAGEVQDINGRWIDQGDAVEINGYWYDMEDEAHVVTCHVSDEYILRREAFFIDMGDGGDSFYVHQSRVRRA